MRYRIALDHAAQRELRVLLELDGSTSTERTLRQAVWTPGSYLLREYSRHVDDVQAFDAEGRQLGVRRAAKNRWTVPAGSRSVRWRVHAHDLSVRTAYVHDGLAFWNGACVLLWPTDHEGGATLDVEVPEGWCAFTGQGPLDDGRLRVADFDAAIDTPVLVAPRSEVAQWTFPVAGRTHRFVAAGLGAARVRETFVADLEAIVAANAGVFGGELPYREYVFLALFTDEGRGGLEHADGSVLLAPRTAFSDDRGYEQLLGLAAHEHFHAWNVKRMRPVEFWRYDLERESHTELLWFAEGFTAYYDDLVVRRAGRLGVRRYLEILAGHFRTVRGTPGRHVQSLSESSYDAWLRLYRPDPNLRNSTQNYYTHGAVVAFLVDAAIRDSTQGARSLDDAMRHLFETTYGEGRGYDREAIERSLAVAAGRSLQAELRAWVDGPFDPPLDDALRVYGLELEAKPANAPYLGLQFKEGSTSIAAVTAGTPAFAAGLCPDDEILAVADLRVAAATWPQVWKSVASAGEPVELLLGRRGRVLRRSVTPVEHPEGALRIVHRAEQTAEQRQQRRSWLGG